MHNDLDISFLNQDEESSDLDHLDKTLLHSSNEYIGVMDDIVFQSIDDANSDHEIADLSHDFLQRTLNDIEVYDHLIEDLNVGYLDFNEGYLIKDVDRLENEDITGFRPLDSLGQYAYETFADQQEINSLHEWDDVPLENALHQDLGFTSNEHQISFGGYYNNDGTYHWESDNANTDKDGNIVSYT